MLDATYVAARPIDGEWKRLIPDADEKVQLPAADAVELVRVCSSSLELDVDVFQLGPGDPAPRLVCPDVIRHDPLVRVHLVDASQVDLGIGWFGGGAGLLEGEEASALPGVHDVIASDINGRYTSLRGVVVTPPAIGLTIDMTGAAVEVARDLPALEGVDPSTTPEQIRAHVFTPEGATFYTPYVNGQLILVQPSTLLPGDQELIEAMAIDLGGVRTTYVTPDDSGPTSIPMSAPIDGVDVTWNGTPSVVVHSAGTWPEQDVTLRDANLTRLWSLHRLEHWPRDSVQYPDLSQAPGWSETWTVARARVDHVAMDARASANGVTFEAQAIFALP